MSFRFDMESVLSEMDQKELSALLAEFQAFAESPAGQCFGIAVRDAQERELSNIETMGLSDESQARLDVAASIGRRDILKVLCDSAFGLREQIQEALDACQE